jgi:hypothetical protein
MVPDPRRTTQERLLNTKMQCNPHRLIDHTGGKMVLLFHSTRTVSRGRPLHQGQTYTAQLKGHTSSRRYSAQPLQLQEEEYAQPIITPLFQHRRRVNEILTSSSTHANRNYLHSDEPKIGRLVLVRHGQSEWNVTDPSRNLTARFVSIA